MSILTDLKNSGQAFLYVFVDPKANLNTTIMQKRIEQLARLNEMYQKDKTYTPTQMIEILRNSILAKYRKTPELILQIIYDNAVKINHIGATLGTDVLTFDKESNQYYDGSGNAFVLDSKGNVVTKNGQSTDLKIETPASLDNINVATPGTTHTFWDDVASVITWISDLLKSLGITKSSTTITAGAPGSTDWAGLSTGSSLSSAGIGDYLPYVVGAGIVYYLISGTNKKGSKQKSK